MRVLIIGLGRMGLSHAAQLSGSLGSNNDILGIDPSWLSRTVAKFILPTMHCFQKLSQLEGNFDICVIATPPSIRTGFILEALHRSKRALVEKPVLMKLQPNQMSGYVMQHCPVIREVETIIHDRLGGREIKAMEVFCEVTSNINFEGGSTNWRYFSSFGINHEFLGHAASFVLAPIYRTIENFSLLDHEVIRELPNHSEGFWHSNIGHIRYRLVGASPVRKTSYKATIKVDNWKLEFSPYEYTLSVGNQIILEKFLPEFCSSPNYFLRGFEFANQADRLICGSGDIIDSHVFETIESYLKND